MGKNRHFYFLTWEELSYSRTGVLYKGLLKKEESCQIIKLPQKKFFTNIEYLFRLRKTLQKNSIIIVGSPCSIFAIICRIALPNSKIIYDSGWPLTDGLMSRSFSSSKKIFQYLKLFLVDFLAYRCSNLVAFETETQRKTSKKKFLIRDYKAFVSYTGFNEVDFGVLKDYNFNKNKSDRRVLFRGKYNLESGLDFLAKTSFHLDSNIKLTIICPNLPREINFSEKVEIIKRRLSNSELAEHYLRSNISLGQLGVSRRTVRTIPHKFYESLFFEVPYLTRRTSALDELLDGPSQYILFSDMTPIEFSNFLASQLDSISELKIMGESAKNIYQNCFSQNKIAENFLKYIDKIGPL